MTTAFAIRGLLGAALAGVCGLAAADAPTGRAAVVSLHVPEGMAARSTALILSGAGGWTDALEARAQRLSGLHTLAIGIDSAALLAAGGSCEGAAALLGPLAASLREEAGAAPRAPVLVGIGTGVELAVTAALASPHLFKGLVSDGYGRAQGACAEAASLTRLGAKAPLRWTDLDHPDRPSPVAALAGVRTYPIDAEADKSFYRSYLGIAGTDSDFALGSGDDDPDVLDLPLTVHSDPAAPASDTYAIFLSGDGGWARFDKRVAERLAARGIPVAGLSSLRYLWREKTPEQIAADMARLDRHFRKRFGRARVLLIGFSLGANVTPFYARHLPHEMKERLAGIGLIAPETRTGFEIVIGGWLGRATGAVDVAAAIERLGDVIEPASVACLHGREERHTPCPGANLPGMARPRFEGGHHLGKAYDAIAAELIALAFGGHQQARARSAEHSN